MNQLLDTSNRLSDPRLNAYDKWVGSLLLAQLPERFSRVTMTKELSGIPITADKVNTIIFHVSAVQVSEIKCRAALAVNGFRNNTG